MRLFIGITFLFALGCAGSASATQTTFPIKACSGCTAAQMQTSAKNSFPLGIGFIYDLHVHVIRKYEVYMDSTCGATPAPQTSTGGSADCGSFKAADEMTPVDATVQSTFDELWAVDVHKAAIVENGTETMYANLTNPRTHQPFDLQQIAWDYPGSSYVDYLNTVNSNLVNQDVANAFDPYLGDMLFGWKMNSFHVEVMLPPVAGGSLSWDRSGAITLNICNVWDDCAKFQVAVTNGVLSVTFLGIYDEDNNIYPNANGQTPGNLTQWGFRNGGHNEGEHFADEMRSHGVYIPTSGYCPPGTYPFLTTTRQNNQIIFQSWSCQQN